MLTLEHQLRQPFETREYEERPHSGFLWSGGHSKVDENRAEDQRAGDGRRDARQHLESVAKQKVLHQFCGKDPTKPCSQARKYIGQQDELGFRVQGIIRQSRTMPDYVDTLQQAAGLGRVLARC